MDLVGGGMIGITTMLKEISQSSSDLQVINHGDQYILLEYGKSLIYAVVAKMEMKIYREKLISLRNLIEGFYGDILQSWNGKMEIFQPVKNLVKSEFGKT
jgi:hypothetical protein